MSLLGRLRLNLVIKKDFPSSEVFMEELGWWIFKRYLFLPTTRSVEKGKTVEFIFTLRGAREILKGKGVVVFLSDGTGSLPAGLGIEMITLTPRSEINLKMIQEWQEQHPSPPQGALVQFLKDFIREPAHHLSSSD